MYCIHCIDTNKPGAIIHQALNITIKWINASFVFDVFGECVNSIMKKKQIYVQINTSTYDRPRYTALNLTTQQQQQQQPPKIKYKPEKEGNKERKKFSCQ